MAAVPPDIERLASAYTSEPEAPDYDVIVIGGGPAGSTSAAVLASRGLSVLLLERFRFPRFHTGESLLTYEAALLQRLGLDRAMKEAGFPVKSGAEYSGEGEDSTALRVDFSKQGDGRVFSTYQVERSEFDKILFEHAIKCGANGLYNAKVLSVDMVGERITGVRYSRGGSNFTVRARRVLDASGRAGIISRGHFHTRKNVERLRKMSVFRHFMNVSELSNPGKEGDIQIGLLRDGWVWAIPIGRNKLSVGVVISPEDLRKAKTREELFDQYVERIPRIKQRITGDVSAARLYTERDFAYYTDHVAGPGFMLLGDAGCFVDPIFAAGVYLAIISGMQAGELTADSIEGNLPEQQAAAEYSSFYKTGYDTYFRLVYAFYDELKTGAFFQRLGGQVSPVWTSRIFGGDFWSTKNPLANLLRSIDDYRTFDEFKPYGQCPVYPELDAAESPNATL